MSTSTRYYSEVYLLGDVVTVEQWQKFYLAALQYCGAFSKFELLFTCRENFVARK